MYCICTYANHTIKRTMSYVHACINNIGMMYIHAMNMHDVNCPSQLPWNDPTTCIMAGWWSLRDALSWTGTVTPRSAVGNSPIIGNCSFTNYIPTLAAMVSPHSRSFTVVCSFAVVKQHLIHEEIPSMSLCKS